MTLKEMFKPKVLVNLRGKSTAAGEKMPGGWGLKAIVVKLNSNYVGEPAGLTGHGTGLAGKIVSGLAESSFCYFYTSLPWNLLCWPFVSDLGRRVVAPHRTAKTQASVKIKLVSTYSLAPI